MLQESGSPSNQAAIFSLEAVQTLRIHPPLLVVFPAGVLKGANK